jgi:hypothetical protein
MLPSLTKNSLIVAADACSRQDSACPNQVQSGDWPMWTSSAAHAAFLYMDGPIFDSESWDETVSKPLNLSGDVQWVHERAIVWNTNNDSNSLNDQAITLTHNLTVNSPGGQAYTMNAGFFSLNGAENNMTWMNTTGYNNTQGIQLATAKQNSLIKSLSYGLQIGSPSLDIEPSLVLGGYDRSLCLTKPLNTQNRTFQLVNVSVGTNGSGWPFSVNITIAEMNATGSQVGLMNKTASLPVLANPGVPYLHLPRATCDAIAKLLPVTYNEALGLYLWNTETDTRRYEEITTTYSYLSFTFRDETSQDDQEIYVPFSLLDLELDSPIVPTKTRYFPCRPYAPEGGQPFHLGRAFLQAALLVQNWETNTTWLAQAPGPNNTSPSRPVIIEETDTTIAEMPNAPAWLATWNGTLRDSTWSQSTSSGGSNGSSGSPAEEEESSLSGRAIAGIAIGAVAGLAIIAAVIFFYVRRRRSKAGYGDVALVSFDDDDNTQHHAPNYEPKGAVEALSSPVYEVESAYIGELAGDTQKKHHIGELPSDVKNSHASEVDGTGIAELPGHDV